MNGKIISEFERLNTHIGEEIDQAKAQKNMKVVTANQFRLKQLKNVLSILKKYPSEITLDNYMELKDVQGIGKGSLDRISEILKTGKLSELSDFKDISKEKKQALTDLESVVGIGHANALELYNLGVTSVDDLISKVNNNQIDVNEKIMLGLKYYGKFEGNIPRKEIDKINKLFGDIIAKLNKKLKEDEHFIYEICGSYRREKDTSGDIDILISKKSNIKPDINYLEDIVNILKSPLTKNDSKPLIVDDMTDKNFHTKYMGFSKYKNNPNRRIDIRFIPYESYYPALVYFTGSADLNKKMRSIAKTKKLKLSEYGLYKENGESIPIHSERDVFDALNMEYLHPRLR